MSKRIGRPPGSGWLENAILDMMPSAAEWTVAQAAECLGTSREAVSHTAGRMANQKFLIRVRKGVYRQLSARERHERNTEKSMSFTEKADDDPQAIDVVIEHLADMSLSLGTIAENTDKLLETAVATSATTYEELSEQEFTDCVWEILNKALDSTTVQDVIKVAYAVAYMDIRTPESYKQMSQSDMTKFFAGPVE